MSTHTVMGFFLSNFLLEVAGVRCSPSLDPQGPPPPELNHPLSPHPQIQPYVVSVCTFLGRAWDAVTDPAVGHFVARTKTPFGSLRPW